MSRLASFPAPSAAVELGVVVAACWAAFAGIPLALGGIGLGWDALNHHIYLGWVAERPRFHLDVMAASYQAYQFPYLYWPVYRLLDSGVSGAWAGVVLASMHVLLVPAIWLVARTMLPEGGWYGLAMRWMAVVLAFLSGAILSLFDATTNDLLAAIPLVWAVAFALVPGNTEKSRRTPHTRFMVWSGACAGIAVAVKLSNGPLAALLPIIWVMQGTRARERVVAVMVGSAAAALSFLLVYGYWGWQLWLQWGNPIFPFYDGYFAPWRAWFWRPS